jgi:hypothetical protein
MESWRLNQIDELIAIAQYRGIDSKALINRVMGNTMSKHLDKQLNLDQVIQCVEYFAYLSAMKDILLGNRSATETNKGDLEAFTAKSTHTMRDFMLMCKQTVIDINHIIKEGTE